MIGTKQDGVLRQRLRIAFDADLGRHVEAFERDLARFSKFDTQRIRGQNQGIIAGDDAIKIAAAAALPVVGDADIVGAGFLETMREADGVHAALFAELLHHGLVFGENRNDRLQGRTNQRRAILKYKLLSGVDVDLEIIDIAGLRYGASENGGQKRFDRGLRSIVGFFVVALAVVRLNEEAAFRAGAERRKQTKAGRPDFGVGRYFHFDSHLVARRQRAYIDRGRRAIRSEAIFREIREFLHTQNFAGDTWLAEIDGAGLGEVQAFHRHFHSGTASDTDWRYVIQRRWRGAVTGGVTIRAGGEKGQS